MGIVMKLPSWHGCDTIDTDIAVGTAHGMAWHTVDTQEVALMTSGIPHNPLCPRRDITHIVCQLQDKCQKPFGVLSDLVINFAAELTEIILHKTKRHLKIE